MVQLGFIQHSHGLQYSEKNVSGFKHRLMLFVALICSKCINQKRTTTAAISKMTHSPRRKLFKHLSIAQQRFLLWFCCFDFVYPSLSRSAGFILCCLNLFPTNCDSSTQKNERTSQWKHNLFILGMSQLPGQHYWKCCMVFRFFHKHSETRPLDWREGCIDSDMFISMAKTCWVSNKTSTLSICCRCVRWNPPSNFYG